MEVVTMTNKQASDILTDEYKMTQMGLKSGYFSENDQKEQGEWSEALVRAIKALKNESNLKSRIGNIIAEMENDLTESVGSDEWNNGYNGCCRTYLGMLKDLIK